MECRSLSHESLEDKKKKKNRTLAVYAKGLSEGGRNKTNAYLYAGKVRIIVVTILRTLWMPVLNADQHMLLCDSWAMPMNYLITIFFLI